MSDKQARRRGEVLKRVRLNTGIRTQKELAERAGIAACIISDLERGKRELSPAWAMKIAEALGIRYELLLETPEEIQAITDMGQTGDKTDMSA